MRLDPSLSLLNPSQDLRELEAPHLLLASTMSSYVFICDHKGDNWSAKRFSKDEDAEPLEAEASSTYELQKKLSDLAKAQGAAGGVSLTFSYITQKKALCQVRSALRHGCTTLYLLFSTK